MRNNLLSHPSSVPYFCYSSPEELRHPVISYLAISPKEVVEDRVIILRKSVYYHNVKQSHHSKAEVLLNKLWLKFLTFI